MNSHSTLSTITKTTNRPTEGLWLHQLPKYAICAGLGIVGGATGVALAIGLVILLQTILFPTVFFTPGTVGLTIAAAAAALTITWLIDRLAQRIFPGLFEALGEKAIQVMMVFSVFTSLLQSFLFTRGI